MTSQPDDSRTPSVEFVENLPELPDQVLSVVRMKAAGASDDEIAQVLAIPGGPDSVNKMVERAIRKEMMRTTSTREYARALVRNKLDELYGALAGKALNPNHPEQVAASRAALAIIDRHAKLYGLDAPTEVTVHTPDQEELAKLLNRASGLADLPNEANILDLDDEDLTEDADVVSGE